MASSTAVLPPATDLTTGALVEVRGQKWVVSAVDPGDAFTMVTLQSIQEGRYGETLDVLWEVEPGRRLLPSGSLPDIAGVAPDHPDQLAAFAHTVGVYRETLRSRAGCGTSPNGAPGACSCR